MDVGPSGRRETVLPLANPSMLILPSWRTPDVLSLTQSAYEARDFAALPILADTLEDAGCTDADLLSHLRGPGPHVRGCWVVDLLLGKG